MHELSIAQNIVEIVQQHLPPDNTFPVKSVRLKLGAMAGVVADSLEFCFTAMTAGTRVEGATLEIEHVPLRARCGRCSATFTVDGSMFICPACDSTDLAIISGRELQVTEIEVLDEHDVKV